MYIDGFNLYHGLRDQKFRKYYWLDMYALARTFAECRGLPICCKYFTAKVKPSRSKVIGTPDKSERQQEYLNALQHQNAGKDLQVIYGNYKTSSRQCEHCMRNNSFSHEKQTDVNIALEMVKDAYSKELGALFLLSGDSDLAPALKLVREITTPKIPFIAVIPSFQRDSFELANLAHKKLHLSQAIYTKCQMPDKVGSFSRPLRWK